MTASVQIAIPTSPQINVDHIHTHPRRPCSAGEVCVWRGGIGPLRSERANRLCVVDMAETV